MGNVDRLSGDWAYANVALLLLFLLDDLASDWAAMDFFLILILIVVTDVLDDLAGDWAAMHFFFTLSFLVVVVVEVRKDFASDRAALNPVVMVNRIVFSFGHIDVVLAKVVLGIVILVILVVVVVGQDAMAEHGCC